MMRLYLDCVDGGVEISPWLDLEFSGVAAPAFALFENGMFLRYEFRVRMNPWVVDQWVRLSGTDGSFLFEGYLWAGSAQPIATESFQASFEEGPCPRYPTYVGRDDQLTVPMTANVAVDGVETSFTQPGVQRLGSYLFYAGALSSYEYPGPWGPPADAPLGDFCLGYVKEPQ